MQSIQVFIQLCINVGDHLTVQLLAKDNTYNALMKTAMVKSHCPRVKILTVLSWSILYTALAWSANATERACHANVALFCFVHVLKWLSALHLAFQLMCCWDQKCFQCVDGNCWSISVNLLLLYTWKSSTLCCKDINYHYWKLLFKAKC